MSHPADLIRSICKLLEKDYDPHHHDYIIEKVSRYCARPVLCQLTFPSAPALGFTNSAAGCPALFVGFTATMAGSDFS